MTQGLPAAAGEGFYFGLGLGFTAAESPDGEVSGIVSEADFGVLALTGGYRWDLPGTFVAAEIDLDLSLGAEFEESESGRTCEQGADGPHFCSHDATVRLRGLYGGPVGSYEAFVSGGLAVVIGDSAVDGFEQESNTNLGVTLGLGLQRAYGGSMVRGELIYDRADRSLSEPQGFDPDYEAVTVKATFLF